MDAGISKIRTRKQPTPSDSYLEYAPLLRLTAQEMNSVEVVDTDGVLVMFHYKSDANLANPNLKRVRGVVIDTRRKYIVCKGGIFTSSTVSDSLTVGADNIVYLTDQFDADYEFDMTRTEISEFYEPVYFRAFLHNNKFYLCTSKKLNPRASNSRWYDHGEAFTTIYDRLLGPSREELFSAGAMESPYVYDLTLVDQSINLNSLTTIVQPCNE